MKDAFSFFFSPNIDWKYTSNRRTYRRRQIESSQTKTQTNLSQRLINYKWPDLGDGARTRVKVSVAWSQIRALIPAHFLFVVFWKLLPNIMRCFAALQHFSWSMNSRRSRHVQDGCVQLVRSLAFHFGSAAINCFISSICGRAGAGRAIWNLKNKASTRLSRSRE